MKNKIIVSSILTIALCLSMIAGSTFALFTSESRVDVTVNAGTVDVDVDASNLTISSTLGTALGTADLTDNVITLTNLVPGDYVTFTLKVTNKSNVTVNYRALIKAVEDNGLLDGLVITYDNEFASDWKKLEPTTANVAEVVVTISLPETASNDYQNTSCKLAYVVEAVQGNVEIVDNIVYKTDENGNKVISDKMGELPEKVSILEGTVALKNKWLKGNTTVKEVVVPVGLTDFGGTPKADGTSASGGFFYGSAVEKVTLPEGLTEIPAAAFNQATKLKEVNIPSTVTTIGINAFAGTGLESLTIPATVTSIGYGAFRDMANLTTVTIEGDAVHIPDYTFRNCANLTSVYLMCNTLTLDSGNMAFTNTSTNNENPNNITIYTFSQSVYYTLVSNDHVKANVVLLNDKIAEGLYKAEGEYYVESAEGLMTLHGMMADKSAGRDVVINLMSDLDMTGHVWTPIDSHIDLGITLKEFNGNGNTIKNLTVNGQAMFKRFANNADVVIKNLTFDNATVNHTGINTSIIVGQTYNNVLLDNVDVKNSTVTGGYKVATLIASVYNESSSTITATLKNCDVENVTVRSLSYDFYTAGLVSFVYTGDNDKIEFENCTVNDLHLYAVNVYSYHAPIYCDSEATLYSEADGVTVGTWTFENIQ